MGKYKHHSGSIGGGVNLSKGKTPHDKDIKDMPLFKMDKYSMGTSMRGPLDKMSGKAYDNKEAYNKNLTAKARLHYLENEEHDDRKGMSMKHGKKHDGPGKYMDHKGPGKYNKGPLHQAKPDYPDIDGDGNTSESMKQAAKDKGKGKMKKEIKKIKKL